MIIKKASEEERRDIKGGMGSVHFIHILDFQDMYGKGKSVDILSLSPGVSIGFHIHYGNFEQFYVMEGYGVILDGEQQEYCVEKGSVLLMTPGEGHEILNKSDSTLKLLAVTLYS